MNPPSPSQGSQTCDANCPLAMRRAGTLPSTVAIDANPAHLAPGNQDKRIAESPTLYAAPLCRFPANPAFSTFNHRGDRINYPVDILFFTGLEG